MGLYETLKSIISDNQKVNLVKEHYLRHELSERKIDLFEVDEFPEGQETPFIVENIDILVAPTKGIYNSSKLQAFMLEIAPILTPAKIKDVENVLGLLKYGQLIYEEPVGNESTIIDKDGQVVMPSVGNYLRRITITLYPNEAIAIKSDRGTFPYPNKYLGNMANIRLDQLWEFLGRKAA